MNDSNNYGYFDISKYYNRYGGHGNGIIMEGRVRAGKTYLTGIIAKYMMLENFYIIANVRFDNSEYLKYSGKLFYVKNDLDVFNSYLEIPENSKILLIWDDAQGSEGFKSTHTVRKSGDSLQTFLIFIGKLEMNYLIIMHNYLIPYTLIDGFEPIFLYKIYRHNFYLSDKYLENNNEILNPNNTIEIPVPKVNGLKILTKAIAKFSWILDLQEMFDSCSDFKYGENLRLGIKEYLDEHKNENEYSHLENLTWHEIAIAIKLKKKDVKGSMKLYEIINTNVLYSAFKKV